MRTSVFLISVFASLAFAAASGFTCNGKKPGKYCSVQGSQMIVTCTGGPVSGAVDCGLAVGKDGVELVGHCFSNGPNDDKAYCVAIPSSGPCKGLRPGKYCAGEQGITTCVEDGSAWAVDCGVAIDHGKTIYGVCRSKSKNDGKAYCKMP